MSLVAIGSVHGSPGVTTTVLGMAAAWPSATGRDVLVVEADPDGGVLAARFDELSADKTLADVAVDIRRTFAVERVMESTRRLWGGVPVVVAPPSAERSQSALVTCAERLAVGLSGAQEIDALVDVGRMTVRSPCLPLVKHAGMALLVTRPTFEDVAITAPRVAELGAKGCEVGLVVVGDRPYPPTEVAAAVGADLVGVVPADARSAVLLAGGPGADRRLRRSLLWRSLHELAGMVSWSVNPSAGSTAVVLDETPPKVTSGSPATDAESAT
jgi:MinD-like ATPase involved in chromosome partitioning or flagellar assembly